MDQNRAVRVARDLWWLLVIAVIVAGGAAYWSLSQRPTTYESQARLLVGPVTGPYDELRAGDSLTRTYAELATSQLLLDRAITRLSLPMTARELSQQVRAVGDGPSRILTITVLDGDPSRAETIANALATMLRDYAAEQAEQSRAAAAAAAVAATPGATAAAPPIATTPETRPVRIVDRAQTGAPVAAYTWLLVAAAAIAGAAVALSLGILWRAGSRSLAAWVEGPEDVLEVTGAAVLGSFPAGTGDAIWPSDSMARSRMAGLTAEVDLLAESLGLRSVALLGCSGVADTGRLVAGLATRLSRGDARVTVVDLDHRRAEASVLLGASGRKGVGDLSVDAIDLPPSHIQSVRSSLSIVPVGTRRQPATHAPGVVLESEALADDLVLLVVPPVSELANAIEWAAAADATLLVVRVGETRRRELVRLVEMLSEAGGRVIGTVLDDGSSGIGGGLAPLDREPVVRADEVVMHPVASVSRTAGG